MQSRTTGAIATGPSQNMQGGVRFFSLTTGEMQERAKNDYTLCPIPSDVIQRVERMARRARNGLIFEDRNKDEYSGESSGKDDSDDESYTDSSTQSLPGEDAESVESSEEEDGDQSVESTTEITGVDKPNDDNVGDVSDTHVPEMGETAELTSQDNDEISSDKIDDNSDSDSHTRRSSYGRRLNAGNLARPLNENYEYQYFQFLEEFNQANRIDDPDSIHKRIHEIQEWQRNKINVVDACIMTQYSLWSGLKRFGKQGKEATMKELNQMLKRDVFSEIEYTSLSAQDKERALPILLFLTMKRDGTIKGRACADGRKQRIWMQKAETSSPTIAPKALFYTLVVDALEDRDVATCDLPGHFLQTDMEERLILRIDGDLARLLVKVDPKRWKKHMRLSRRRPVIYVMCNKAIYGTLNAALLSYKKLIGHLTEWGFKMNPYEPCCWNKTIGGLQATIVFHVDDLKLSHKNPDTVSGIISQLELIYATLDPMTVTRGKVHQYLGMTINFRVPGEVRISMYDYIKRMIDMLPKDMIGNSPTPASDHLFKTDNDDVTMLTEDKSELFHSLTAMSLYLGKRARPDLQTPTAFLRTRVQKPNQHDWKKLSRMMKYIQSTKHLPLILKSDGKGTSIYIDGAHAVHADMKGHAGAMTTEGSGSVFTSSTKIKPNTLSSTETEIVSTGEKLPKFVWYRHFRIGQGSPHKEDILFQDNKSAILLNENGRASCGKGSKHIAIRYFFITDRIARKEIRVVHCPTEEMIADYFTKPLQGSLFRKMRNAILGIQDKDDNEYRKEYLETIEKFGLTDSDRQ